MASVERLSRDGRAAWQARWRDPANRQRKKTFPRRVDAERFLAGIEADKLRGAYVDPRAGQVTLAGYATDRWLPAQVHIRPGTRDLYRAHLRTHVLPALGNRPLSAVRRSDCRTFVAALSGKLAPATVGTVFAVLRMVMQGAVDDELLAANPCSRVPLPRVERPDVEPLAPAEVVRLTETITPRYSVAVFLAAGAGLRQGEVLGLLAGRVDFLHRRIAVEQQLAGLGVERGLSPLKTRASRRVVPVDDVVLHAVSEHLRRWPTGPADLLVTNRSGRPIGRSSFQHCWTEAVAAAGLPVGTRYHGLRHFYASTLIAAGLHPKAIQARLGHATISETMDTYGHLFPDSEHAGRGALDAALGGVSETSCAPSVPR